MTERQRLGERAEELVCAYLAARGYRIVGRNVRVGRREIDIIAARRDLFVFCEVRARTSDRFASPLETIDRAKIARLRSAARDWLQARQLRGCAVRFDAASVLFDDPAGRLDYREDAF